MAADKPKDRAYSAYTVRRGDSFWSIACKFSCTMDGLNNKSISQGQTL
ncbi:LysM peptidoglycan-binding domain-containing protein [Oscillibacter sp.]